MKLTIRHPHALPVATLRGRIDQRVEHYGRRYPQVDLAQYYAWDDETHAHAAYRSGKATFVLSPQEIVVDLELPFFARVYRGKIEGFLQSEMALVTRAEQPDAETRGA